MPDCMRLALCRQSGVNDFMSNDCSELWPVLQLDQQAPLTAIFPEGSAQAFWNRVVENDNSYGRSGRSLTFANFGAHLAHVYMVSSGSGHKAPVIVGQALYCSCP